MTEHEKAKEPLPTRPPRPHPQGLTLPPLPTESAARRRVIAVRGW